MKNIEQEQVVWILESSYKDGDTESCGVFDSPRAMAVGLSRCIVNDNADLNKSPYELAGLVAALVFDMFYTGEGKSDECRSGDTVYGCDVHHIQSLPKGECDGVR